MIDIKNVRSNFPIFLNNKDLVYLDSAASSLKHKNSIRDVMDYYMQSGSNVGRGSYKIQLIHLKCTKNQENTYPDILMQRAKNQLFSLKEQLTLSI